MIIWIICIVLLVGTYFAVRHACKYIFDTQCINNAYFDGRDQYEFLGPVPPTEQEHFGFPESDWLFAITAQIVEHPELEKIFQDLTIVTTYLGELAKRDRKFLLDSIKFDYAIDCGGDGGPLIRLSFGDATREVSFDEYRAVRDRIRAELTQYLYLMEEVTKPVYDYLKQMADQLNEHGMLEWEGFGREYRSFSDQNRQFLSQAEVLLAKAERLVTLIPENDVYPGIVRALKASVPNCSEPDRTYYAALIAVYKEFDQARRRGDSKAETLWRVVTDACIGAGPLKQPDGFDGFKKEEIEAVISAGIVDGNEIRDVVHLFATLGSTKLGAAAAAPFLRPYYTYWYITKTYAKLYPV